jgi:predicted ATPase
MNLQTFSSKLHKYLKLTGNSRKTLANALELHPTQLSHKLNGTDNRTLSFAEVKSIVKILADWEAISTRQEALELLGLMDCPAFSQEEWTRPPLNRLDLAGFPAQLPPTLKTKQVSFSSIPALNKLNGAIRDYPPARYNLPASMTSFIGRKAQLKELRYFLTNKIKPLRLLTLLGPGGVGKSRLMLEVAAGLVDQFEGGVWLVELASLTTPALLAQVICVRLGLTEQAMRPFQETLIDYLQAKEVLLLLDNCEHLVEACASLVENLLEHCPRLKVLTTSREFLGIQGELKYQVPSLALPKAGGSTSFEQLKHYEAIRLFLDRAELEKPGFKLDSQNIAAVVLICQKLDGIPLALELAAARLNALTVEQIASRLDQRFRLLTIGNRTALPRQKTLKALIDWSYDLLSEPEKTLLRGLAVFRGGWTLEAAIAISRGEGLGPDEVENLLHQLINKSLVIPGEVNQEESRGPLNRPRFSMLETIRQYAFEKLAEAGEMERRNWQHSAFYLELSEEIEQALNSPDQPAWLSWLEEEHDNLRIALAWLQDPARQLKTPAELGGGYSNLNLSKASWAELSLRLAGALWRFWFVRNYLSEGILRLEEALRQARRDPTGVSPVTLAKALKGAGNLTFFQGDYQKTTLFYEESLALSRETGDRSGTAKILANLANIANATGENNRAIDLYEESRAIFQELGETRGLSNVLVSLGGVLLPRGEVERAQALTEQALALVYPSGDKWVIAWTQHQLGVILIWRTELEQAKKLFDESLVVFQSLGDKRQSALILLNLGEIAKIKGENALAVSQIEEAQVVFNELGDKWNYACCNMFLGDIAYNKEEFERAKLFYREGLSQIYPLGTKLLIPNFLLGLATVALKLGHERKAMLLCGAAEALRNVNAEVWNPQLQVLINETIVEVSHRIGPVAADQIFSKGQNVALQEIITFALSDSSIIENTV